MDGWTNKVSASQTQTAAAVILLHLKFTLEPANQKPPYGITSVHSSAQSSQCCEGCWVGVSPTHSVFSGFGDELSLNSADQSALLQSCSSSPERGGGGEEARKEEAEQKR